MGKVVTSAFEDARRIVFRGYAIERADVLGRRYSSTLQIFNDGVYAEMIIGAKLGWAILLMFLEIGTSSHRRQLWSTRGVLCGTIIGGHDELCTEQGH